ncbi:MAG: beta-galactosidase, partial [Bacteroidales bacterium]|nr:beta-galactosidase [Bacteroidales bacterium]
ILLNGTWKLSLDPPNDFWLNQVDFQNWSEIEVPGECQMQGFPIKHDQPFVYKTGFQIPADYEDKKIFLDFYGVYSYARVWVNGQYVRDHHGGFTQWECDITDFVTPGAEAILTIEVTDRIDDISYASGYAKHQIGGILRDVELRAVPRQHFNHLWYETELDENYQDARLTFFYEMAENSPATMKMELFDKNGKLVESMDHEINSVTGELVVPVKNPEKWDAEHPNLYSAKISLSENSRKTMTKSINIGFREVVVDGNKLLVNGKPVKLRGANRHDIHPTLGRKTTPEYDKLDVLLAKEANINFIRTSHYPPTKAFLKFCDQYGMYVEDETAVCFVGSHRLDAYQSTGATQSDSLFRARYLSQLEEMVTSHRNHPSIIIWSIGNENIFGENFVLSYNWVKENDQTRPVIYSYPGHVPDSLKLFDILSVHYPDWTGDRMQYGITTTGFSYDEMPALFDEWAHHVDQFV